MNYKVTFGKVKKGWKKKKKVLSRRVYDTFSSQDVLCATTDIAFSIE